MSYNEVKRQNDFFRRALKNEIEDVKTKLNLSPPQEKIFDLRYGKKYNRDLIADTIGLSVRAVDAELALIRDMMSRITL